MIVAEIDENMELKQKFATVAREKRISSHITQERLAEGVLCSLYGNLRKFA